VVPLHGPGTTVILTLHGDPHPRTVSHLSQWSVYTRERDACNSCQKVFKRGLDADYAHSTASQTTFGDCFHLEKSLQRTIGYTLLPCSIFLASGYSHKRCILSDEIDSLVYVGLPMANIAAVRTGGGEGMNDEEVFTRVLAGEPELCEIVIRRPRSQTFSRPTGFHATFGSKRIWRINSLIPARSGWPSRHGFP